MSKKKVLLGFCLMVIAAFCGCDRKNSVQNNPNDGIVDKSVVDTTYKVYYLKDDMLHLEGVSAIYTSETPETLAEECIESLCSPPDKAGLLQTIPQGISVEKTVYDGSSKQVDIYFDQGYKSLPKSHEILVRAAVVLTMTQFDGVIDYVQFFAGGEPLTESDGRRMIMMKSDFVENTRADIKRLNQETLRLYFASSDGTRLVAEDVYVHYYKTYSPEKVIVESLISGPITKTLNPTLSSDVKLYDDISVSDGICYVDFNQRFLDRINNQSFAINVYSVVNSLTELDYIDRVLIRIDGEIVSGNDSTISLSVPLSRNEELIVKPQDTLPVVESDSEFQVMLPVPEAAETERGVEETEAAD